MRKKVIVTGASGQTGSYMVDYLLANTDHDVIGVARRTSKPDYSNLEGPRKNPRFYLEMADLSDSQSIDTLVQSVKPDYFINFAAQSFVGASWQIPEQTFDICAMGVLRSLESIRKHVPNCRFYNAGSSEEFGDVIYSPQDMKHPFRARSPYGASKIAARQIVKVWRDSYNLYAVQGLLFNHESERRGEEFVTRKITKGVARIKMAMMADEPWLPIELGNIEAKRDWSHAEDFVAGVWQMLNQKEPKEYILASGETHSIREFITKAFIEANIFSLSWHGEGVNEVLNFGDLDHLRPVVKISPKFYRPAEVDLLQGDSSEARKELGWNPKISFDNLVRRMVHYDLNEYI